jgi:PD-(D/E)XK nuclease superfamily
VKPFLKDVAEKVILHYPKLEDVTLVFPNRRAALFFQRYLADVVKKPVWSPQLLTIEDLFQRLSSLLEADRLTLVFKLYGVYQKILKTEETFDKFYFWGDMLLRDFDEVDKYMIKADLLFKDLSAFRELDEHDDYLTDEQKKFLEDFWSNFENKPTGNKEEFLNVWRSLPRVYAEFSRLLRSEGIGYEGMMHRDVAERIRDGKKPHFKKGKWILSGGESPETRDVVFAGFNALTLAEEIVMEHFVQRGARVFWDVDAYYMEKVEMEAGHFFRRYREHPILGGTFPKPVPDHFSSESKRIQLYGIPQRIGQAKLAGQLLDEQIKRSRESKEPIQTVIVLPDESMLLPVLHSMPDSLDNINVTMGYPLRNTPFFDLLDLLLELQTERRGDFFNHRQVTAILGHAYVLGEEESFPMKRRREIISKNQVLVPATSLQQPGILGLLFVPVEANALSLYLLDIVRYLGAGFSEDNRFDKEYAFHFYRHISRLHDVLKDSGSNPDFRGYQKLFHQVVQTLRIPFTGEPLKGVQIMGVLETRNLDFDNVFMLSMNEGSLPAAPRQGSYIPHALRKAYGLPTQDHQDSMYAYLFYRAIQRAKNVCLFYNTEPDVLGMGEMSRFLLQLLYESGWPIEHHILTNPVQLDEVFPIIIPKTNSVIAALDLFGGTEKGLSPSVLNDYIECSLRFYLKHIARWREAEEVEEDLDARIFGNFVHEVMDWFYRDLIGNKGSQTIEREDLNPEKIERHLESLVDRAFREHYHFDSDKPLAYSGQSVVVRAIVLEFIKRILKIDLEHTPFEIQLLEEKKFGTPLPIFIDGKERQAFISGRIDRIDEKDGIVRVIDYKTGKDGLVFKSVESLFAREGQRNKAAFQTFLYAWLYSRNSKNKTALVPVLLNRAVIFGKGGVEPFKMGKTDIDNVLPYLKEFESGLTDVVSELYNAQIPFSQTEEINNCQYCQFKSICRR